MRSVLVLCFAAALCLAGPAIAQFDVDAIASGELVRFERQLSAMLDQLSTDASLKAVFREHAGGLRSLSAELPGRKNRQAGGLILLAVGQQAGVPNNPAFVSNPPSIFPGAILNFWWAVYNTSTEDITAATKLRVKGPGGEIFLGDDAELDYPAGAVTMFWTGTSERVSKSGIYQNKVTVAKAKRGKNRKAFFVVP